MPSADVSYHLHLYYGWILGWAFGLIGQPFAQDPVAQTQPSLLGQEVPIFSGNRLPSQISFRVLLLDAGAADGRHRSVIRLPQWE